MSKIKVYDGEKMLQELELGDKEISIGRGEKNDIILPSGKVSRKQAVVKKVGNNYVITDWSGRGTTFKNEQPVISEQILNGDEITIGKYRLVFEIDTFNGIIDAISEKLNKGQEEELTIKSQWAPTKGAKAVHQGSKSSRTISKDLPPKKEDNLLLLVVLVIMFVILLFLAIMILFPE